MTAEPTPLTTLEAFKTWAHLFPRSDDASWENWIYQRDPGSQSLVHTLKGPYRATIKARMVALLLVPDFNVLPELFFGGKDDYTIIHLPFIEEPETWVLEKLPHEVILFAQDVVCECFEKLDTLVRFSNPLTPKDKRRRDRIRKNYYSYLRQFMAILGEAESQKCCERYLLDEGNLLPVDREDFSDAFELNTLLRNERIPAGHKRTILARVHELIEVECARHAPITRDRSSSVTKVLLQSLYNFLSISERLPFPESFAREEFQFLLSLKAAAWVHVQYERELPMLLKLFQGPEHREMRRTLARRALIGVRALEEDREESRFYVDTPAQLQVFEELRAELQNDEPHLCDLLTRLIENSIPAIARSEKERRESHAIEDALM